MKKPKRLTTAAGTHRRGVRPSSGVEADGRDVTRAAAVAEGGWGRLPEEVACHLLNGFLRGSLLSLRLVSRQWSRLVLRAIGVYASLRVKAQPEKSPRGYGGRLVIDLRCGIIGHDVIRSISDSLRAHANAPVISGLFLIGCYDMCNAYVQQLAEALRVNTSLTILNLDSNKINIGAEGAEALAEGLKTNSTLTALYLSYNAIGDAGTQALCDALRVNRSLAILDVQHNRIGDTGALAISDVLRTNSSLTALYVGVKNSFTSVGIQALIASLHVNSTLACLDLSYILVESADAEALAEALQVNSTLTCLGLSYCDVGDAGAAALAGSLRVNRSLTSLDLLQSQIGAVGCQALAGALHVNSSLTVLDLSFNKVCDIGAMAISDALRVNRSLTSLRLCLTRVSSAGANALTEALIVNSSLKRLDVSSTYNDNEGYLLDRSIFVQIRRV